MTLTEIRTYTKEIAKGLLNKIFDVQSYSLQEKKIGYWVDGRPLYQKTLNLINVTNSGKTIVDISDLNFDVMVNMFASILYHAGSATGAIYGRTTKGCGWSTATNFYSLFIEPSNGINALAVVNAIDGSSGKNVNIYHYVTLQYTKTTDIIAGE